MRKREFRPRLEGRLEERVTPAGHPAVVVTTSAYYHSRVGIDDAVDKFTARVIANPKDYNAALFALVQQLKTAARPLPFGQKVLLPALVTTLNNYLHAPGPANIKLGLGHVVENYIEVNSQNGNFKYLQSNFTYPTDSDIQTQGHVPKKSNK